MDTQNRRSTIMRNFDMYRDYTEEKVNAGIEANRKGYAFLHVVDAQGNPVPGARVTVEQKTHAFRYGANLFMLDELETPEKNAIYKQRFAEAFNMATLPFYWDTLEPEKGQPRFAADSDKIYRRPPIDLCIDYCKEHGIEPREHALAYQHFFPPWLHGKSNAEVKREYERRCAEIAERYADKIPTIEVTNEMFWKKYEVDFYKDPDYVAWCFKTAEKYFPNNKLGINEWSAIWEGDLEHELYLMVIENALLKGARIDAVGLQFHMFFPREEEAARTAKYYDPTELFRTMDAYARFHRPMQITEVTVPAYSNDPEDEALQAEILEKLYGIWFSYPNIEQIVYWNLVDGYAAFAPQGDMTAGENYYYGGLLRFDMTPKPAYHAIRRLFGEKWHTHADLVTDDAGAAAFKGFYGDYEAVITVDGKEIRRTLSLEKGASGKITVTL